ncbi:MAG: hypothetical protein R2710_04155 [Acidimicrobiales bacterium]
MRQALKVEIVGGAEAGVETSCGDLLGHRAHCVEWANHARADPVPERRTDDGGHDRADQEGGSEGVECLFEIAEREDLEVNDGDLVDRKPDTEHGRAVDVESLAYRLAVERGVDEGVGELVGLDLQGGGEPAPVAMGQRASTDLGSQ